MTEQKLLIMVGRPMDWRRTHLPKTGADGAEHGQQVETLCNRVGTWSKYRPRTYLGVCKQCTAALADREPFAPAVPGKEYSNAC